MGVMPRLVDTRLSQPMSATPWFMAPATTQPTTYAGGAGVYLTDEVFLYRVVALVTGDQDDVVDLEDCYFLDTVHVRMRDLRERGLRVVSPEDPGDRFDQAARLAPGGAFNGFWFTAAG